MNTTILLDGQEPKARSAAPARAARGRAADDMAMLKAAAELTRDLNIARPQIYWPDFLASAAIGYAALAGAIMLPTFWAVIAGLVSILALYRASSFIHEIAHVKQGALPGFKLAWNLLIGIPLLVPSFMYEGVHNQHHAKTRYGTVDDPEYLPLALMKPWSLPLFVVVAALGPIALLFRFGVLSPLSSIFPALRDRVVARYSSLSINPDYRRREPEGAARTHWRWQAAGASIWAIGLVMLTATGVIPLRSFLIYLAIVSIALIVNQVRTLVAHLWENEGEAMSVTAQYLDSVNVPPPGYLPFLWAPVGLRYHALHHLLPGLPYHALGEAHRRITGALDAQSVFHHANYRGLAGLVGRLAASTMRRRA